MNQVVNPLTGRVLTWVGCVRDGNHEVCQDGSLYIFEKAASEPSVVADDRIEWMQGAGLYKQLAVADAIYTREFRSVSFYNRVGDEVARVVGVDIDFDTLRA